MTENRSRRKQNQRRRRMRTLQKPTRLNSRESSTAERHQRGLDATTRRRIRDDRLFGALCHAGIFLGLWGLVTTTVIWAFRKDRSRVIRFQGAQALLYQGFAQALVFIGAAGCCAYLLYGADPPLTWKEVQPTLSSWIQSGVLGAFSRAELTTPFLLLCIVEAGLAFVATLLLLLCLAGLEPSYPLVGYLARKVLGLRTAAAKAPQESEKESPHAEKAVSETTGKSRSAGT